MTAKTKRATVRKELPSDLQGNDLNVAGPKVRRMLEASLAVIEDEELDENIRNTVANMTRQVLSLPALKSKRAAAKSTYEPVVKRDATGRVKTGSHVQRDAFGYAKVDAYGQVERG